MLLARVDQADQHVAAVRAVVDVRQHAADRLLGRAVEVIVDQHGLAAAGPDRRQQGGNRRAAGQRPIDEEVLVDHVVDPLGESGGLLLGHRAHVAHGLHGQTIEQPETQSVGQHFLLLS